MTNNQVNMRELALEILLKVLEQEEYSNVVLQQVLQHTNIWKNRIVHS